MGKHLELKAADGHTLAAYLAEPAGKPRGAVIVIQEIFGVNSHIRAVADGYAADGYLAIAPALFDRAQRGVEYGYTPEDIQKGFALKNASGIDNALKDVAAALEDLGARGRCERLAGDGQPFARMQWRFLGAFLRRRERGQQSEEKNERGATESLGCGMHHCDI